MKKILPMILVITLCLSFVISVNADFSDISPAAPYSDAVYRLYELGIMSGYDDNTFSPDDIVTREQFAKVIVLAAGLQSTAEALQGITIFSDVEPSSAFSGYVTTAVNKGYIAGMPDGKFHPGEAINFAQACTIMVKALGYTDSDVPGVWYRNYVDKALDLGITEGISLTGLEELQRGTMAIMIDNLMVTNIKGNPSKSFSDALGIRTTSYGLVLNAYSSTVVNFDDTETNEYYVKLYTSSNVVKSLRTDADYTALKGKIVQHTEQSDGSAEIKVLEKISTKVNKMFLNATGLFSEITILGNSNTSSKILNNQILTDKGLLYVNNNMDTLKVGGKYKVIADGDFVVRVFNETRKTQTIKVESVDGNIVYFEDVNGAIRSVVLSDKTTYYYNGAKQSSFDAIKSYLADNSTVILGYTADNSAFDYAVIFDPGYSQTDSDLNYAVVLNISKVSSTSIEDFGSIVYYAKLFNVDGNTVTYKMNREPEDINLLKGKLVKYTLNEKDIVVLETVTYMYPAEIVIDRYNDMIDSDYAAENIKIFDIVSNDNNYDAQVRLAQWKEIPDGKVPAGKILYIFKDGIFDDVKIMLVNDITEQKYRLATVSKFQYKSTLPSGSAYSYTLSLDGKDYTYNSYIAGASVGSVVRVRLLNNSIFGAYEVRMPQQENNFISAVDSTRIKVGSKIYRYNSNIKIYFKDSLGNLVPKGTNDIIPGKFYGNVQIYLDKPYISGGRVEIIIVSQ